MGDRELSAQQVTINPALVRLVTANPGARLPAGGLVAVATGIADWYQGCIEALYYFSKGSDLDSIRIKGHPTIAPANLNDFREKFEQAACCGQEVGFGVRKNDNKIQMLWVYPCKCCRDHNPD